MLLNGAQILMECLKEQQVDTIFGYPGGTILNVYDELYKHTDIHHILTAHEQGAAHAADGYARSTGKVGVCFATSGPGATNLTTGIATAYMDSIPMVAITGQVPSHLLGRDIFQEVDITGAVTPFTKHTYLVKDAAQLPRIIKEAFYIASTGRPGPVLIDIPSDVQEQTVQDVSFPEQVIIRGYNPSVRGNDKQISNVADAISRASRPVICAGGGVFLADAKEDLLTFARQTGIPVVTTMMGLSLLETEDPLYMGMIGAHGNACANRALAKSDLLIMIGTRAADRAIIAPDEIEKRMPSIHIDVDPAEIGKNMRATVPLVGNVKVILHQLMERAITVSCEEWCQMLHRQRQEELQRKFPSRPGSIFPGRLFRLLGQKLDKDAAVCVDVGQNQLWACKHLVLRGGRLLTSGGLGTMGYSLGAAIGVKTAQPQRQTVVICGDGSFQMSMNELAAIQCAVMDVKIVLMRNNTLGMVHEIQKRAPYRGPYGVSLDGSPAFETIAAAYGIPSITVNNEDTLDEQLDRFLRTEGCCLLICEVHPDMSTTD